MSARPPVKWAGGKRHLSEEILKRLPDKIATYHEPFVGGGAVFFALQAAGRFKKARLNDSNIDLMCAYHAIKENPSSLIKRLREHGNANSEEYYYKVRARRSKRSPTDIGARLMYLNKTCFNGLYRVNKKGEFNVPCGKYKEPTICDEENIGAASVALQGVELCNYDFEKFALKAKPGDAVYFDPPYAPVSETASFTTYTATGFLPNDHVRLRLTAALLAGRGVHVLLSNSDTPFIRKLYKGFKIEVVQAPRRINSKASARGNVRELLISWRA